MELSTLTALSPLDGRYADKAASLRSYLSEFALIRYRVLIEVRWLQHLADEPTVTGLEPLPAPVKDVLNKLVDEFSLSDAARVKEYERTTNHDVKAVEYFIRDATAGMASAADGLAAFIHFACTSEDINNLAYALMLRDARQRVLIPKVREIITDLRQRAHRFADLPMLSRTHGQSASPTTLGKELANFLARLEYQLAQFEEVAVFGKLNGAVGNFNAHMAAYPDADWTNISQSFVRSLGLEAQLYTTQIEPHDWIAAYCHSLSRLNTVLIDFAKDIWGYVSLGYFRSRPIDGEVGSSTMPHKVNPIDFENGEGNLGLANALLEHQAGKLPISRWQRDLTDSTVLRTLGASLGHSLVAYSSIARGMQKLEADEQRIGADLNGAWEVLAEAIQTVMRAEGITDAYEQLKELTRGRAITEALLDEFIVNSNLSKAAKDRLRALTPAEYIGMAAQLAKTI